MMSLAETPGLSVPSTRTCEGLRLALQQALRGQHVLHLAGADAERQRAECAVRRRVAVAADDGHAGLRQSLLRTDHVHDALLGCCECRSRGMPKSLAVLSPAERAALAAIVIEDGQRAVAWWECCGRWWRWSDPAGGPSGRARAGLESLRRGDFVHQVQIDIEQRGRARLLGDDVGVPDFFDDGAWFTHNDASSDAAQRLRRPARSWRACPSGCRSAVTLPRLQHRSDGGVHRGGFLRQSETIFEHRRHRADRAQRIGLVLARDVRRRAVYRLVQPTQAPDGLRSPIEADGSMPIDPASTAPSSLRISPNMFSVSITSKRVGFSTSCMAQLSTSMWSSATSGNSRADLGHHAAPELRIFEHVRFVDRRHFLAAAARQVERHARHALDLRARVDHGVDGALIAPLPAMPRGVP